MDLTNVYRNWRGTDSLLAHFTTIKDHYEKEFCKLLRTSVELSTTVFEANNIAYFTVFHTFTLKALEKSTNEPCYTIGHGSLYGLPGCCGVAILSRIYIHSFARNKKVGQTFFSLLTDLADAGKYTLLQATNTEDSKMAAIFCKQGWHVTGSFKNRRSGNTVFVWTKELPQIPKIMPPTVEVSL